MNRENSRTTCIPVPSPEPSLVDVPQPDESSPPTILLTSSPLDLPTTQTGTRDHEACASIGAGAHLWLPPALPPLRRRRLATPAWRLQLLALGVLCAVVLTFKYPPPTRRLHIASRPQERRNAACEGISPSACAVPRLSAPWTFGSSATVPARAWMLARRVSSVF